MVNNREFGIKVDSSQMLEDILKGEYVPKNDSDKKLLDFTRQWYEKFGCPEFSYVYYGSEFCSKRFPNLKEILDIIKVCKKNKKKLVLLCPAGDDLFVSTCIDIIEKLESDLLDFELELEINDYGLLYRLNKMGNVFGHVKYRGGRLLDKSFHDGRIDGRELQRLHKKSEFKWYEDDSWLSENMAKVFLKNNLIGFDLDVPVGGVVSKKNNRTLDIGVFVPYSYITTGGICMMKNLDKPILKKFDCSDNNCSQKCRKYYEVMKKRIIDIHEENLKLDDGYNLRDIVMYRVGNTIFYLREDETESILLSNSIGRVIFEPKLML